VCPASAVSDGLPGVVRAFTPRWSRQLVAPAPDPLAARFIADFSCYSVHASGGGRTFVQGDAPAPAEA